MKKLVTGILLVAALLFGGVRNVSGGTTFDVLPADTIEWIDNAGWDTVCAETLALRWSTMDGWGRLTWSVGGDPSTGCSAEVYISYSMDKDWGWTTPTLLDSITFAAADTMVYTDSFYVPIYPYAHVLLRGKVVNDVDEDTLHLVQPLQFYWEAK